MLESERTILQDRGSPSHERVFLSVSFLKWFDLRLLFLASKTRLSQVVKSNGIPRLCVIFVCVILQTLDPVSDPYHRVQVYTRGELGKGRYKCWNTSEKGTICTWSWHIVYLTLPSLWRTESSHPVFFGTSKTQPKNLVTKNLGLGGRFFGMMGRSLVYFSGTLLYLFFLPGYLDS